MVKKEDQLWKKRKMGERNGGQESRTKEKEDGNRMLAMGIVYTRGFGPVDPRPSSLRPRHHGLTGR